MTGLEPMIRGCTPGGPRPTTPSIGVPNRFGGQASLPFCRQGGVCDLPLGAGGVWPACSVILRALEPLALRPPEADAAAAASFWEFEAVACAEPREAVEGCLSSSVSLMGANKADAWAFATPSTNCATASAEGTGRRGPHLPFGRRWGREGGDPHIVPSPPSGGRSQGGWRG